MSSQPVVATVVPDTTLIGTLGNFKTIIFFLGTFIGHKLIMIFFSFVVDLLSSEITAFFLFVVSFMMALALYFMDPPRNSYAYKLPLLLASVLYMVYRNSTTEYTGIHSCDIGNVAFAFTGTMTPTLFYGYRTRHAPCNWMVLFNDTKCLHTNELKLFRGHVLFNSCNFIAIEKMGMQAVTLRDVKQSWWDFFFKGIEKPDYVYRTAMGYYIISMQRHILCGYLGYLLGWGVFVAVEVYKTCMECQKDSKIDPKEMNKVTWSRVFENVWALWQWDVEAKGVHQEEFKFTSGMALSIVLTWAWVQTNIVLEPNINKRALWFSDHDHWYYTVYRLLVSDPFFWFILFHPRFFMDKVFKVLSWVRFLRDMGFKVWSWVNRKVNRKPWMYEEAYVHAHVQGMLQEYDTDDDDYEQHDTWKGEDESLDW
jgi:hypothetical protein